MESDRIPARADVASKDKWNLSSLFSKEEDWEAGLKTLSSMQGNIDGYRVGFGASAEGFTDCLEAYARYMRLDEKLGNYASLRVSENEGESASRGRYSRYASVSAQGLAKWAWFSPAILALDEAFLHTCLEDPRFLDYRVFVSRILRYKPHTLSGGEERLLALQSEPSQTIQETFGILTNVDMDFGSIQVDGREQALTQSTLALFLRNPDRSIRENAYRRFYREFDKHKHTLASLYAGALKQDKFLAQAKAYTSSKTRALFPDDMPEAVYDNLVSTVGDNLKALHTYYELRKKFLGLDELRHYDAYVPFVEEKARSRTYEEAVETVSAALTPLGEDYVEVLRSGLLGSWVDRYENRGKRSGAFSSGGYDGDPFILLNYKPAVMRDMFTIAHEGGHSMHTWYSRENNPFTCYSYTIFEAEVASTFNEQLLFEHLYKSATTDLERAMLISTRIDDTLATLYRQTMFAEYEARIHDIAETGKALTVDAFRDEYRSLLTKYFGPTMKFEEVSDLEGLRIPHFYNAFYVYKYATGISASIALAEMVLKGGEAERKRYRAFLESGGSRFPLESLKLAGVDMSSPGPIQAACDRFRGDVEALESLAPAFAGYK